MHFVEAEMLRLKQQIKLKKIIESLNSRFYADKICRGYYMPARGYEFYLRVFNSKSYE